MRDAGRGSTPSGALGLMAIAITGLLLTGCATAPTSAGARDNVTTPAADAQGSAPAESAPAQAAEPDVTAPSVGATVTTADEIAAAEAAGLGVYTTSAGARVVIDPAAPTAQVIIDDARATGGSVSPGTLAGAQAEVAARNDLSQRVADAGGKKLVFIAAGNSLDESGNATGVVYVVQTAAAELKGRGANSPTVEGAITIAQERIAAQADPSQYEIINLVG